MIAGPPGAGKSTVALAIAMQAQVPTLYASADSHESTMAIRSLAMCTGIQQSVIEERIQSDPGWATAMLRENASHIRWMFDASPTLADLEDEINVYRELMGESPSLVVVDNAVDVTHDSGDEFSSLRSLMREVKWWSRDTGAAFLILHHTSEGYEGYPCPPRSSLHGKIAQIPSLVVTLSSNQPNMMAAAAVKKLSSEAKGEQPKAASAANGSTSPAKAPAAAQVAASPAAAPFHPGHTAGRQPPTADPRASCRA